MSFTLFLFCLIGCYQLFISLGTEAIVQKKCVIVIDAGSTASRVVGFLFYQKGTGWELKNSIFQEVTPQLSSFANEPSKCSETMTTLLNTAKKTLVTDKEEQKKTPLALKATAGLRFLKKDEVEGLRVEVLKVFKTSNFYVTDNSFAIMDGATEGLYAWHSVNFLLDRLYDTSRKTVAVLDLGGGSTQIAFLPNSTQNIECRQENKCLQKISINNVEKTLYTQSYLGLGLKAAREGILTTGFNGETTIISDCFHPNSKNEQWEYNGVKYLISGPVSGTENINKCNEAVKSYIKNQNVFLPHELKDQEITAFSYFYDLAVKSEILREAEKMGGTKHVSNFEDAATLACSKLNQDPFMCLDLSIISSLLVDGYGLTSDIPITLLKKINGHEVSWALGASIDILDNGL